MRERVILFSILLPWQNLRLNLDRNIKQLADFKVVMSTINTIQSTTLSVELKIREMQETYNVLEEHRIQVKREWINVFVSGNDVFR